MKRLVPPTPPKREDYVTLAEYLAAADFFQKQAKAFLADCDKETVKNLRWATGLFFFAVFLLLLAAILAGTR